MQKSLCSVVVPCYNSARYIATCLDSILAQTHEDFEIVIVNDGSTDATEEIVKTYQGDPRVKYIRQQNAGPAKARNNGVKNSDGDFIAFLDSDDLWKPTKLEKQMQLFADPAVGVVYTDVSYIDNMGVDVFYLQQNQHLMPKEGKVTPELFIENFVPFSSVVARKECFEKAGMFDENLHSAEDWELLLRFSVLYEFRCVHEKLLRYRFHSSQLSNNFEKMNSYNGKVREEFIKHYKEQIPPGIIRRSIAYTNIQTAYYYRSVDIRKAIVCSVKALKATPWDVGVIKSFIKTCLIAVKQIGK